MLLVVNYTVVAEAVFFFFSITKTIISINKITAIETPTPMIIILLDLPPPPPPNIPVGAGAGQSGALQGAEFVKGGHGVPPLAAGVVTVRVRVCIPVVPHCVAEHGVNSDQSDTAQSTGHGGALHGADSVSGSGQGVPPFAAGVTTVLVRVCVPVVPHANALHGLIGLQSDTTQFTAGADPPPPILFFFLVVFLCITRFFFFFLT